MLSVQLPQLAERCVGYMRALVDMDSLANYMGLAERHGLEDLMQACLDYAAAPAHRYALKILSLTSNPKSLM